MLSKIPFLDSHTGGEPTRLVDARHAGALDLGQGSVAEKLARLSSKHDNFRSQVLNEPRGSDVMVGALLVKPRDPTCQFGVIYFNNVGYLGMCGHGTIGLMASLSYQGRITPGTYRIETPVGIVEATLHPTETIQDIPAPAQTGYANNVSVRNIPAYRHLAHVPVEIKRRIVHGDVAWGGNWFFLCHDHGLVLELKNLEQLTEFAWHLRETYTRHGLLGADGHEIDHVELFASTPRADSQSFVLCPGKAYDRSPCGTGTSAKLACLYADGKLREGQVWRQESIVGSIFEGQVQVKDGQVIPTIRGEAWVMAEGHLLIDPRDPFANGIRA
jgi:4-hydroxyproline epimerase